MRFVLVLLALFACLLAAPDAHASLVDAGHLVDSGPDNGLGSSPSIDWVKTSIVIGGALWTLVSTIVALTPTKRDDKLLAAIAQRFSFLRAPNVPRGWLGILSLPGTRPRPNAEGL